MERTTTPTLVFGEDERGNKVEAVRCPVEESTHHIVKNGKPVFYKAIEKKTEKGGKDGS